MRIALAGLIIVWICGPPLALAQEVSLQPAPSAHPDDVARQLLTDYWAGGVADQRNAADVYQRMAGSLESVNLDWAYVLNRLNYNQVRQAATVAASLIERNIEDLDIWYAHIWLQMTTGNVNEGLLSMQKLKQHLGSLQKLDDQQRLEMYGRMGRLFGYADGPSDANANQITLDKTLAILIDGLTDDERAQFDDQRLQVNDMFEGLIEDTEARIKADVEQAIVQQQQQIAQLNESNRQIDDRQQVLVRDKDKLRDQATKELSQLDQQIGPVESDVNRLAAQLNRVRAEISWLASDLAATEFAAIHEPDPVVRNHLLRHACVLRRSLQQRNSTMYPIENEYYAALGQLENLQRQYRDIQYRSANQAALLDRESDQLSRSRNKNIRLLNRLNKPQIRTGFKHSRQAKTRHLATYDPFPANEIKQKLLDRL